jgi:hypothetical protein
MNSPVKLLSSTALAAAALVMAAPSASAQSSLEARVKALEKAGGGQTVTRSKKTMKLVVSGHINRLIQFVDDGTSSGFKHVTSIESRSRVRWVGTGKINDDLKITTYIELGNRSASSTAQDLGNGFGSATADQDRPIRWRSKRQRQPESVGRTPYRHVPDQQVARQAVGRPGPDRF